MLIKNPVPLSSTKYIKKNVRVIYWSTFLFTGAYIYERLYYNINTGKVSYTSYIYISPFYRNEWHSYSSKYEKEKRDMREQVRKQKSNYMKKNMMRIDFSTFMGHKTFLRDAIVYNVKTGKVSYTSFFELKTKEKHTACLSK